MKILSCILWLPLISAFALFFLPFSNIKLPHRFALISSSLTLSGVIYLAVFFDPSNPGDQFKEQVAWNKAMGSYYALAVDGLSMPMVLLAGLLCAISLLAGLANPRHSKNYYVCCLALQSGLLGVFMARDWALFYVFWELTLVPLFFLIDQWGGRSRHTASLNFVLYTMGGSVFMLLALLYVYTQSPIHSTLMDSMEISAQALPENKQLLVFLGLLLGFGVKVPVFPLHGWLPLAHVEAPGPVSILLSGIMLKMGAYGLLRTMIMLPEAAIAMQSILASLAFIGIVYGALLAWRQTDFKAMIAYSSISHMGWVLLGLSTMSSAGITGAWVQMMAHGFISAALFMLAGLLYERTQTREITDYGSLMQYTPRFALLLGIALLGSLGLPGTLGFIGELDILIASMTAYGYWTLLPAISILVSGAYLFRTLDHLLIAPTNSLVSRISDLRNSECYGAAILLVLLVTLGIAPDALMSMSRASISQTVIKLLQT